MPARLFFPFLSFLSVPFPSSAASLTLFSHSLPKASFKEYTHHFITLMNLVGFSRRGRPPASQRQMPPVPRQLLLMFKVMHGDRLIKRRLRDALGLSLSRHDGSVTRGSRVWQRRNGCRRMKMVPKEHPLAYMYTHTHKPPSSSHRTTAVQLDLRWYRCSRRDILAMF